MLYLSVLPGAVGLDCANMESQDTSTYEFDAPRYYSDLSKMEPDESYFGKSGKCLVLCVG